MNLRERLEAKAKTYLQYDDEEQALWDKYSLANSKKKRAEVYLEIEVYNEQKLVGLNDVVGVVRDCLSEIVEDMRHIPERRLPLGKNCWLQEWYEVIEKLERLGELEGSAEGAQRSVPAKQNEVKK